MDSTLLDETAKFTFAAKSKNAKVGVFDLDLRLLKAVTKLGHTNPTLVQSKCIPLALKGKDLLVRARTGSGKTIAYALPLLHKILLTTEKLGTGAIVLVPSRELVAQVKTQLTDLCYYCKDVIKITALTDESRGIQISWLQGKPDVVVATPGRLNEILNKVSKDCKASLKKSVQTLVVDEADLIFSYGYADDVTAIMNFLPRICQSFLMSATLSDDVTKLKKLVLHNPAIVKLEEGDTDGKLAQWHVQIGKDDKDLVLFALVRLKLVQGKTLFFVNSVERCYRFKLLLEQFHVRAAVLNSELPANSREHIIEQFNKGLFEYLIATDDGITHHEIVEADAEKQEKSKSEEKSKAADGSTQSDFGVARGVDFRDVRTVVNIDFPTSGDSYTHRIGRTARGGSSGTALSLIDMDDPEQLEALEEVRKEQPRRSIQNEKGEFVNEPQPAKLALELKELESFRYRVEDVRRAVTRKSIREARLKEIKNEMLNSSRLKAHFEDNPNDAQLLEHDKTLRPSKVQKSLATIPSYLMPKLAEQHKLQISPSQPTESDDRGNGLGRSRAGRVKWKMQHKKGTFSKKKRRKKDPLF